MTKNHSEGLEARKAFGLEAETVAANYLERRGFEIIKRNHHSQRGEVDLICRRDGWLIFVEVKAAAKSNAPDLAYRIPPVKRRKLALAARDFLQKNQVEAAGLRFDALFLARKNESEWRVEHLENAFTLDDLDPL